MIDKIAIKNYRIFRDFQLDFNAGTNIIVGDNDAGKSTLLEAINLALTCRLRGKHLAGELSPYLFNKQATDEYVTALRSGKKMSPPEITIDLFLKDDASAAALRGTNNLRNEDVPGVRVRVAMNPDFADEYAKFIERPSDVRLVPVEYFQVEWLAFSGNGITFRSIPATASLIDASSIRLQSGTDYYLQDIIKSHLDDSERVEVSRAYRSLRETFAGNEAIEAINSKLGGTHGDITERALSLAIDISHKSAWENSLVPHLDDLPFQYVGNGEKNMLKILLALTKRVEDAHIVLVEEPENHLSFSSLNMLTSKVANKCKDKQVIVTTHSSYVLNKLGLDNLVLLSPEGVTKMRELPGTTEDYFKKLSGYDTLRLVLAKRVILVEGPSDDLIVQRTYRDVHGKSPIEDGVDVINVGGLTARRFLDIAIPLKKRCAVVNDNDGNCAAALARYDAYRQYDFISVHIDSNNHAKTLEPQVLAANGREVLNGIFGTAYKTDDEILVHMGKKTDCALAIFESQQSITMPGYIQDAVKK